MEIILPSYDVKLARLLAMKMCIAKNPRKNALELAKLLNIGSTTFYVKWKKLRDPEFLKKYRALKNSKVLDSVIINVPSYDLELIELAIIKKCIDDHEGLKMETQLHEELNIGHTNFFLKKAKLSQPKYMKKLKMWKTKIGRNQKAKADKVYKSQ